MHSLRTGKLAGWSFPAAAKRLVETNEVEAHGALAGGELLLGRKQCALGVEDIEEVPHARLELVFGEHAGTTLGGFRGAELPEFFLFLAVRDQGVLHVFQRAENSEVVQGEGLFFPRGFYFDLPADAARGEDGPANGWSERVETTAGIEQVTGLEALQAGGAGEVELREKLAVATPMLAVAAATCRSARRRSGRRSSNSAGSPAGTSGGPAGM